MEPKVPVPGVQAPHPCRPHLQNTYSEIKLLGISRQQFQNVEPLARGPWECAVLCYWLPFLIVGLGALWGLESQPLPPSPRGRRQEVECL